MSKNKPVDHLMLFLLLLASTGLLAQKVINREIIVSGQVHLAEGISVPKINPGYTLWLPENKADGLLVFTHARRDSLQKDSLIEYALAKNLAVLYASTENRLEFFFEADRMQQVENYIHEVITSFNIPSHNMLYCGMSLEGTRALKLAIYGQSEGSMHKLRPRAVVICDSPLDMVRFHREMSRASQLNFHPAASNEGYWVSSYLEQNLGGNPEESFNAYVNYSPYCYSALGGPHLEALSGIAIRAYTEPDVNWWIETRRKDYYGMNAIDLAAMINSLKIKGSQEAELMITRDRGYQQDGTRHPHSWNIIDEKEMIDWFLKLE